jgi:hypothetical protein
MATAPQSVHTPRRGVSAGKLARSRRFISVTPPPARQGAPKGTPWFTHLGTHTRSSPLPCSGAGAPPRSVVCPLRGCPAPRTGRQPNTVAAQSSPRWRPLRCARACRPNPSLNRTLHGRPAWPGQRYWLILRGRAKLPCRSGPVSSNVSRHKSQRRIPRVPVLSGCAKPNARPNDKHWRSSCSHRQ